MREGQGNGVGGYLRQILTPRTPKIRHKIAIFSSKFMGNPWIFTKLKKGVSNNERIQRLLAVFSFFSKYSRDNLMKILLKLTFI